MNELNKTQNFKFKVFEAILYIIGYTIAFFLVSKIFDSFKLDQDHPILYAFISVLIIMVLNKTIKPILTFFTLIIITPLISFILKLVDFILLDKLNFTNIWILFFISIILSAINLIIELLIIKPIIKRMKLNG